MSKSSNDQPKKSPPDTNPVTPRKPTPVKVAPAKEPVPCGSLIEERVREIAREEIVKHVRKANSERYASRSI